MKLEPMIRLMLDGSQIDDVHEDLRPVTRIRPPHAGITYGPWRNVFGEYATLVQMLWF